jgi:hypothetical protein
LGAESSGVYNFSSFKKKKTILKIKLDSSSCSRERKRDWSLTAAVQIFYKLYCCAVAMNDGIVFVIVRPAVITPLGRCSAPAAVGVSSVIDHAPPSRDTN